MKKEYITTKVKSFWLKYYFVFTTFGKPKGKKKHFEQTSYEIHFHLSPLSLKCIRKSRCPFDHLVLHTPCILNSFLNFKNRIVTQGSLFVSHDEARRSRTNLLDPFM
uniref:Putative ovule protein n=1 Tax=Solanum chacoense TaxID=4108 RepID=A0A0V0ILC5_SOLCH